MSKKSKEIDLMKFAKKVHEEVQKWPKWKRDQAKLIFTYEKDTEKNHCGCGYVDCNNRGY